MFTYIVRRVLLSVPVLLGVSLAVFSMMHLLPIDPVMMMVMDSTTGAAPTSQVTDEMIDNMRIQLGLDKPLPVQFGLFLTGAVQGDLGKSFRNNQQVSTMLAEQLPFTIWLTIAGMSAAILLGLTLGVLAGMFPNTIVDHIAMTLALVGVSVPSFWLGLMLIFFVSLRLDLLPALGTGSPQALILPAVTLGFQGSAIIARLTRSNLVEIMNSDYIRTARSKGFRNMAVVQRHALRNALIPVITVVGLQFGHLMSGAVVVETVFGRPGIGRLGLQGILEQDFPLVQGFVLLIATFYVVSNLIVDFAYAFIDPRIRLS